MIQSDTNLAGGKRPVLEAQWLAADESLREAISRFATQARFEEDFFDAVLEFWGVDEPDELPVDLDEDSPEFLLTFEWYLYDYCEGESSQRMIDLFADVEGDRLPPLDRQLLGQWREAALTPYEVLKVKSGVGYSVRSLVDGAQIEVDDGPTSEELHDGDLMVARLLPGGSKYRPSSVFRTFTAADMPRLQALMNDWFDEWKEDAQDEARDEAGSEWDSFLRERGYLFNDYALERQALAERMSDAPDQSADEEDGMTDSEQDPQQRAAFMHRLSEQYLAWTERGGPAMGGLPPRVAIARPEWRKKVISTLREMGEIEASYALVGEPAFEITTLLPRLGLQMSDLG